VLTSILYGLESCFIDIASVHSLDFIVTRFGMKIFRSGNRALVLEFNNFGVILPSVYIRERTIRFSLRSRFEFSNNSFCQRCLVSKC
jgi:hypothetical protein